MCAKNFVPVVGYTADKRGPSPVAGVVPPIKKWSFSFKYWGQTNFFGLDKARPSWFVSLLDRLKALSAESVENFLRDPNMRDAWRYHEIDWEARNCPITREELIWLPKSIRSNEEDFPLMQFQVSKALGRVVGFIDSDGVFNIVLLDPLHNIQPSNYNEYKLRPCGPLDCEYTALLHRVDVVLDGHCRSSGCKHVSDIEAIQTGRDERLDAHVVMMKMSPADKEYYDELKKRGNVSSFDDIFRAGLLAELEKAIGL